MTPEQENELVARWMNWRALRDGNGMTRWVPPNTPPTFNVMACEPIPPDYRADPALLWELLQRLGRCGWSYSEFAAEDRAMVTLDAFNAEAVFAAAVVQAAQEQTA